MNSFNKKQITLKENKRFNKFRMKMKNRVSKRIIWISVQESRRKKKNIWTRWKIIMKF